MRVQYINIHPYVDADAYRCTFVKHIMYLDGRTTSRTRTRIYLCVTAWVRIT